jgi:acylpyruvate hydrolase
MKLLSMKTSDGDRAGILLGEEVLDVTELFRIEGPPGERLRDALDLYSRGEPWLLSIIERVGKDRALAEKLKGAGAIKPLSEVALNPPVVNPGKILAVGLNYAAHAAEQNAKPPETPLVFSKCATALIGPGDPIRLPRISEMIDYEAELAVIIGSEARSVSADRALEYVAGYTIMNDVTARDLQRRERQWARAKGLDTFAPCGPWLATKDEIPDPHILDLELEVNGEVRQSSNTSDLIFKVPQLIEFISQDLTLKPGDIISTGTPSGVGVYRQPQTFLKDGDRVSIRIDRIGTLENPVAGWR